MYTKSEMLIVKCDCGNCIQIKKTWYPGGVNDYGTFTVKCNQCGKELKIDVGRDVYESDVISGAVLLERKERD